MNSVDQLTCSNLPDSTQPHEGTRRRRPVGLTFLALLIVLGVCAGIFWKTILTGAPISRLFLLAEWDSLFDPWRRGIQFTADPSAVFMMLPTYTLVAKLFHAGQLPLWNNFNTFGAPLVGDIQASVFSPLRLLFDLLPTAYAHNLQLVAQVVLSGWGVLYLARELRIGWCGSLLAALSFALCPFDLYRMELVSGTCLVPWVAYLFARAARKNTIASAALAGAAGGVLIHSSHPEISFFGIAASTFLFLCLAFSSGTAGILAGRAVRTVAIAALSAFCVAAPVFIPFIEFLKNADCYKYAVTSSPLIPWTALAFNFSSPGFGGCSPFLGILTLALIPFAFSFEAKECQCSTYSVLALTAVSLIITSQLFPYSLLAAHPPFNFVSTVYAAPVALLGTSLLAGLGLTRLQSLLVRTVGSRFGFAVLSALVATVTIFVPALFQWQPALMSGAAFDMTLPPMAVNSHAWTRDAAILVVAVIAILAAAFAPARRWIATAVPLVLVILNTVSVAFAVRGALPVEPRFSPPPLACMQFLHDSGERCLATSEHLAKPEVNLFYGIDDVRSLNPMIPARSASFITQCGGNASDFSQHFSDVLSNTVDLASVRYVLSQTPVRTNDRDPFHFKLIRQYPGNIAIYENTRALPRAYIVSRALFSRDAAQSLQYLRSNSFDPRTTVILEAQPKNSAISAGAFTEARMMRRNANEVCIEYDSPRGGWLVLTDTYYPGWTARLDSNTTPILRANYSFRAVEAPAGHHRVSFRYQPQSFFLGVVLFVAFIFWFAWISVGRAGDARKATRS